MGKTKSTGKGELEVKPGKKNLVEILETDVEDKDEITLKLEEAMALKNQIGVEPDEKKGVEGSGLLKKYHDLRQELGVLLKLSGLEGLRHNNIAFTLVHMDGRVTLDPTALAQELVKAGVKPDVVKECMVAATKQGEGYYRKELVDLNKLRSKRGGKEDGWT